jgi:hypothetical protein
MTAASVPAVRAALGIATYRRDDYLASVLDGVASHLRGCLDAVAVCHDGKRDVRWSPPSGITEIDHPEHTGVAGVRNALLGWALSIRADWIFLAEDDIVPTSAGAVMGYVDASVRSGIGHLCFHAHGPANDCEPLGKDASGAVTFWPNYVGAWMLYSRHAIQAVGFFDEDMGNAYDHVEHSLRLAAHGFCPWPAGIGQHRVPDATGSENWLKEIPGSIKNSAILAAEPDFQLVRRKSKARWKQLHPDTYATLWTR